MTEPSQYFKGRTVQEQMNEVIGYVDTRSAEVAVNAIAADVAQVHQDMLDADADAAAAAASAAAAAGTLANAVKKTGEASQSIAGDIAIAGDLDVGGDTDITGALDVTGDITGNNASLIGTVTVPTEATGTYSMKSANSTKVKNELDNYAPMVRTTGNQTIAGNKTFNNQATFVARIIKSGTAGSQGLVLMATDDDATVAPASTLLYPNVVFRDQNDVYIGALLFQHRSDGKTEMYIRLRNQDGTFKSITLGLSD